MTKAVTVESTAEGGGKPDTVEEDGPPSWQWGGVVSGPPLHRMHATTAALCIQTLTLALAQTHPPRGGTTDGRLTT